VIYPKDHSPPHAGQAADPKSSCNIKDVMLLIFYRCISIG
jgi:hypothetical protein